MGQIFSMTETVDQRTSVSFDIDPSLSVSPDYTRYNKDAANPYLHIKSFMEKHLNAIRTLDFNTSDCYVDSPRSESLNNGFFSAIFRAWCKHEHLTLSPDNFWYQIIQEVATHINNNSDAFKSLFTDSEEKVKIIVDITHKTFDDGVDLIVEQLNLQVKDKNIVHLFTVPFSTTTALIQTCYGAVLMNAMKNYFEYEMFSRCGIRGITLQGKKDDWINLMSRIKKLRQMPYAQGIETNLDAMAANLAKIISSYDRSNKTFWSQIVSRTSTSGSDYVTGWITDFFIYDIKGKYIQTSVNGVVRERRINTSDIPLGYCATPFIWNNGGVKHDMRLCCGQSGIQILPDKSVSPSFFRAIIEVADETDDHVIPLTSWRSSHTMPDGKIAAPGEWKYAEDGTVIRI
jgi:hypothetical protein